ncbi:hypothetical protein Tco_0770952 [Tanacetum coccineum]|uniref:Uncharacterized protein n=1 Tax=Tanacetum coccineum TaxID=301880 RepID=A0ABQ4ZFL0_9ASTR
MAEGVKRQGRIKALDEERVTTETKTTKDIDWNDPSIQKYWDLKNKTKSEAQARKNMIVYLKNQSNYKMKDIDEMSYDEIKVIFEKIWDVNHNFVPMDLEIEKEKNKHAESQEIKIEQIEKDTIGKRKKSLPRKRTRSSIKKKKVELDDEKEELKGYLDIVPREDVAVDVDFLSTKFPIVDWLVKERYSFSKPEGYDLMLWGDLHTLFEPDKESEIWMNQNEYDLISWSLCDFFCKESIKAWDQHESKPKSVSEPLIKDWISDSEDENETEFKSKQRKPSFAKIEFVKSNKHVKTPRESVKKVENNNQAKYPRKNSQSPRDNKRN